MIIAKTGCCRCFGAARTAAFDANPVKCQCAAGSCENVLAVQDLKTRQLGMHNSFQSHRKPICVSRLMMLQRSTEHVLNELLTQKSSVILYFNSEEQGVQTGLEDLRETL